MEEFLIRVLPGVMAFAFLLLILPKKFVELRIVLYVLIFILFRDTMTPMNFWEISPKGVLRFAEQPAIWVAFGLMSVGFVGWVQWFEPELRVLPVWFQRSKWQGIVLGIFGAILIAVPALVSGKALSIQGPLVPTSLLAPLFLLTFLGNFLEEVLFRGYFQGYLEKRVSALLAALCSAVFFSACHSFLAISVTSLGTLVLLFTLYEGLVCAFLRMRWGVVPAVIAHGGGIFLLASGLVN